MAKDTYIPRNEVVDMNKEFDKVRIQVEKELMQLPGVVSVGVGLKQVKGETQRQLCFKVTVERKIAKSDIQKKDLIPEEINGFKTDVNESPRVITGALDSKYRPLMGGAQIEPNFTSELGNLKGTLGCFAKRKSDNKIVLVSNWHVMVERHDVLSGERIGQPTHNGCCSCCACNEIAQVTDGRYMTDDMDAAIALLNGQGSGAIPEHRFLNEIPGIGILAGAALPLPGETVFKWGITTGLRKGQIVHDNVTLLNVKDDRYGITIERKYNIQIESSSPTARYSDKGDSGSVSVNEQNQVVGLNFGSAENPPYDCFASRFLDKPPNIPRICTILDIDILDSTFHSQIPEKGVPLSAIDIAPIFPDLATAMSQLEAEIGHSREGKRILELFKIHRTELLDLIRHRREVMAAWNRYQGPAYLAHVARSVRRDNKPVPEQIKGISLQNLLLKMTAVLQRNGSPELIRSVTDNYLKIMQILAAGRSAEDWKAQLAQMDQMIYHP